jgi:hypothetical protein
MAKKRPRVPNVESSNQNAAQPARKRRASNISSHRTPAPSAKRIRANSNELNAESEAVLHPDEDDQDLNHEQDQNAHINNDVASPSMGPLPSSPPAQFQRSTSLTQQITQTTLQSTPLAPLPTKSGRGRQSMPPRLGDLSSDAEVIQFAPFSDIIDPRRKRRLSRNHMSEEQNAYHSRLQMLQKKLKEANSTIKEIEFGREADRQMGTANTLDDNKDKLIEELEREKAKLEKDLADHENSRPHEDGENTAHNEDMDLDLNYLELDTHNEDAVVGMPNGEAHDTVMSKSHPPNHASCREEARLHEEQLLAKSIENATLVAGMESILIQLKSLGFTTTDNLASSIMTAIHEAFTAAGSKLKELNLLSTEDFSRMSDKDILDHMVECLEGFMKQVATLTITQTELEIANSQLDHSFRAVDRENDELRQQELRLEIENKELQSSDATKAIEIQELNKAKLDFQNEVSYLKARIDQMEQDHRNLMSYMAEEIDREHSLYEDLDHEKSNEINTLQDELELAQELLEESQAAVYEAEQRMIAAGVETDKLHEGITELRRQRDAERRQREQGEQDYEKLEKDLNDLIVQNNNEKNELRMVIANRQQDIEEAEKAIKAAEQKIADLEEAHRAAMETEISLRQSMIADMDKTIGEERKAGEQLSNQADALKQENDQLQVRLQSADTRNTELENTLRLKEAEYELTIRDRDSTIQEKLATIQEYTDTIQRITDEKDNENERFKGEIADLQDDLACVKRSLTATERKNSDLQAAFDEAMRRLQEHAIKTSQDFQELSQLASQHDISVDDYEGGELGKAVEVEEFDEEFPDEEEPRDFTMTNPDDKVGVTATASVQTTTKTAISRHSYRLRAKEQRDSGVGMMSSSPARHPMLDGTRE